MIELPLNIDFSGKVVVVTGAGGVLCQAMVKAFAKAGAKVAALDLNEEAVKTVAEECKAQGYICEGYKVNVLEMKSLEAAHAQILEDFGPCDILVNGAGGNHPSATTDNEYHHEAKEGQKTFFDLDMDGVDFVFKLNFQGTLLPVQVFAKDMAERKKGSILNISSMNAYIRLPKYLRTQVRKQLSPTSHSGLQRILQGQAFVVMQSHRASLYQIRTGRFSFRKTARRLPVLTKS